jgi:hypothetical protein
MHKFTRRTTAVVLTIFVAGCTNIPQLDIPSPFTVAHIVDQIQCEISRAAGKHLRLKTEQWIAVADLTLQVDDSVDLVPKVSVIEPLATEGTNFTFGASAQLKRARQRIYTETIIIPFNKDNKKACHTVKDLYDLTGDLGITETVALGLGSFDQEDVVEFPVTADLKTAFGHTVQFVITKNVSGVGPIWTLVRFVGPGAFFGAERVDTHKLIISFAQGSKTAVVVTKSGRKVVAPIALPGGRAGAVERAIEQNSKMLLQSLPSFRQGR